MDPSVLPEEILPSIFKYLPIDDRKNVRLTCQVWYNACNRSEIIRNEKFVIRFDPNEDDVAEIANGIVNCQKLRSNFEFHGFPLWQLPSSVLERSKSAIESIYLYNCIMRKNTICKIFSNCLNLRSFHLESRRSIPLGPECSHYGCSDNALDDLIGRKFEQKNLCLLRVYLSEYPRPVDDKMYQKFYQIFPNIRTFGRGNQYVYEEGSIGFPPTMERFTSKSECSISWMKTFLKNTNLKIKELKIALSFSLIEKNPVVVHAFFSNNAELEKVNLSVSFFSGYHPTADCVKELLLHLLKSLPNLKDFRICLEYLNIPLSATELHYFLKQIGQLETLVLSLPDSDYQVREYFILDDSYMPELSPPQMKYTKLTKLKLSFYNEKIYSAILNRCTSSLQYLYLKDLPVNASNVLMSKRWDFTELRTLRLHFVKWPKITDSLSSTCANLNDFVKRLQNLEHLEICGLGMQFFDTNRMEEFLEELELPSSLKYFYFEMAISALAKNVCKLTEIISHKAPNLEILRLDTDEARKTLGCYRVGDWLSKTTNLFVNHCQRMKKLKCVILSPLHTPDYYSAGVQHPVKQLFEACQSLKFVWGYGLKILGLSHISLPVIVSYDRHSAKLKWYIDNSKLETLEWFPKFARVEKRIDNKNHRYWYY